jgi:hypothetical protein
MITIYLKNMAGEMIALKVEPYVSRMDICRALSNYDPTAYPFHEATIIPLVERENEQIQDGDTFAVLINPSVYLLNHTTGTYVETYDYKPTIRYLTRPLTQEALLPADTGLSHWSSEDHIVFVPDHLKTYVARRYARLDIRV